MSYIYAQGNGYSLTEDNWTVSIVHNTTGTDLTNTFHFDSKGVEIKYESKEDKLLLPGIVHSRCTVNTIWEDSNGLTTLITALGTSQDGDYILEVKKGSSIFWIGSLLVDEFTVNETSAQKEVRLVATDGISLLRNVDYNNAGTPYDESQTVLEILENINEKWVLYDYAAAETSRRFAIWEDVYNTDDYVAAGFTHPAGTNLKTYERSRIHSNPWKRLNDAGDYEYIDCYRLLQSLCLSYQWRLFQQAGAWYFMPVQLNDQNPAGTQYDWSGTATSIYNGMTFFQTDVSGLQMLKGNEWSYTFSPQINEVTLHRDPNQGATVLAGLNFSDGDTLAGAQMSYEGADTAPEEDFYYVEGRVYVSNTAVTIDDNEDLARIVLSAIIKFDTGADATYYGNDIVAFTEGPLALAGIQFGGANFVPLGIGSGEYSSSETTFYAFTHPDSLEGHYIPSEDGSRYVDFVFNIPPPPTAKTGFTITPTINIHNTQGQISSTLKSACTINWQILQVRKWSGDELQVVESFDYRATSTVGLDKIELGTTHVGGLGISMGRIQVETSAGFFGLSDNWVNQASSDERPINELCVEEILAMHTQPNVVERGSLVMRGAAVEGYPYNRYYDTDTGNIYAAINWTLRSTISELEVTFRKIGRNAVGITTDYANTGSIPRNPLGNITQGDVKPGIIMHSYHNQARDNFAGDWSSVIGATATKEMYYTTGNDGQGKYIESQGDTPAVGNNIVRTVYVNTSGLQERTDSGWTSPAALQPATNGTLADAFAKIQNYINKITDHGAYTFMVTYEEVTPFTGILDTYTTATAAYSTRRLSSTYEGSLVRVRRVDNNSEQDIGYTTDGDFDEAALETFADGNECTVKTWYDQSGNSNDITNTTTSSQPSIYDGSVFYSVGASTPSGIGLLFSSDYLTGSADLHSGAFYAVAAVVVGASVGNEMIFNQDDAGTGGTARIAQYLRTGSANNTARTVVFSTDGTSTADNTANNTVAANTAYIIGGHGKQSQVEAYVDNVSNGHTSVSTALRHGSSTFRVGAAAHSTTPSNFWSGRIAEVIIFDEDMSTGDITGVNTNIDDYFTII